MNPSEMSHRMRSHDLSRRDAALSVLNAPESDDRFERALVSFSTTQLSISAAIILFMILLTYEMLSAPAKLLQPMSDLITPMTGPHSAIGAFRSEPSYRGRGKTPSGSAVSSPALQLTDTDTAIVNISVDEFLLPNGALSESGTVRLKILAKRLHQGDLRVEFLSRNDSRVSASVRMAEYLLRVCQVPAETVAFAATRVRSQDDTVAADDSADPLAEHRDAAVADGVIQLRMTRYETAQSTEDPELSMPR